MAWWLCVLRGHCISCLKFNRRRWVDDSRMMTTRAVVCSPRNRISCVKWACVRVVWKGRECESCERARVSLHLIVITWSCVCRHNKMMIAWWLCVIGHRISCVKWARVRLPAPVRVMLKGLACESVRIMLKRRACESC